MTSIELTFDTLNSFFLSYDGTLNEEYLNYLLHIFLFNTKHVYESVLINKRIKPSKAAFYALKYFCDYELHEYHGIRYENPNSTTYQIRKYLKRFGNEHTLDQLIEDIENYRKELNDYNSRCKNSN